MVEVLNGWIENPLGDVPERFVYVALSTMEEPRDAG